MAARVANQPDLFADAAADVGASHGIVAEPPEPEFINRVRDELLGYLAKARAASTLPWRDLTEDYLVEMRVYSMSRWLPAEEARALRRDFGLEMDRLYEAADQARPDVWGRDF